MLIEPSTAALKFRQNDIISQSLVTVSSTPFCTAKTHLFSLSLSLTLVFSLTTLHQNEAFLGIKYPHIDSHMNTLSRLHCPVYFNLSHTLSSSPSVIHFLALYFSLTTFHPLSHTFIYSLFLSILLSLTLFHSLS